MIAEIAFWVCVTALLHSYLFYPLLLQFVARNKKKLPYITYNSEDDLPYVTVIMAVYNEEAVISEKIDSLLESNYPTNKLTITIGSDGSEDGTDSIIQAYAEEDSRIQFFRFDNRNGKPNIINKLVSHKDISSNNILIFTDANVIFTNSTIYEMVKYFKDPSIGLVGSNVLNKNINKGGISSQEKFYIQRENHLKYLEGLCWGTMMGAFGACYAIQKENFKPLPSNFLVDDFYITLHVLQKGKSTINNLDAICYEDVSNEIQKEFTRKIRISTGNFQNLSVYYSLLWPPFTVLSFSFLSHKVLRWLGPFFLVIALATSAYLSFGNIFYTILFTLQGITMTIPAIDYLLKKKQIHSLALRFVTYFYSMNLALLIGFINFIKGVRSNVWQRTKRHQP